VVTHGTGTLN